MSARGVGVAVLLMLLCSASFGTAASLADVAPGQWQPTTADVIRAMRPCPMNLGLTPPVCWSVTEDTSAWMAVPPASLFPWGQCTYYVGLMRPDIWNDRAPPSVDSLNDWDAWTWAAHAQAEGLAVDGSPRPGDVIVYSPQAVGNATGHVAMVDAVGATDPSSRDVQLTISEMNLVGLDDASRGEGETRIVHLPQSELVPGMIQFIHRPGPGYIAPSWPREMGAADGASPPWMTQRDPSLAVGLWGDHLATASQSSAPAPATVTTTDGTVVMRVSVTRNRVVALGLPTGTYRVCVAQAGSAAWDAAGACATASWQAPVSATVSLGRPHRSARRLAVPVSLGPRPLLALAANGRSVVAVVRIGVQRADVHGQAGAAATRTVYARAWRLRAGGQVLSLPLSASAARHALLRITVIVRATSWIRVGAAQTTIRLG